ncbi:sentrin-specific protease 1-like [Drosophila takahashii]|uniref:sentrin-specific protease 1-like n=1 Tax=Drosophila takahashii TaxID=29030 RepID=UPI001CF89949|nr:sentrin-specific protease 1-like [Drosophila takahashii]
MANPELLELRQQLADVCHKLVEEVIRVKSTKQSVALLKEIFLCIEDTEPSKDLVQHQRATRQIDYLQTEFSIGLEILKRQRQLVTGWYKAKEVEPDNGEAGSGDSTWKRRHQEENTPTIKYRRVDNSFPRFIANEPAEDLIFSKSNQHRVRNEAPYLPILNHELERMEEHEQYMNLIHASRFESKPKPPPLQRIDIGNRHDNRGLSAYASLISSQSERQKATPMRLGSFNSSRASILSSSSGSSESSDSSLMITAVEDGSNERKANTRTNHTDAAKSLSGHQPTRHRRFSSCIYLKDDFVEQFRAKSARIREESEHRRRLAAVEANRTTEERRAYECKLREKIFQYRISHKPIFGSPIGSSVDKPVERKEIQLIPLTKEHMRRYNELMTGDLASVLVVKFNMRITRRDIRTLLDGEWLNDEVINFYMNLMTERSEKRPGDLPATYAMNTFFVPRLLQSGHAGVKRWTRKVDIFAKDVIPVPVHVNGVHWCMAIIHMRNQTIHYYDSMGQPNQAVLNALEAYLREESLDKRKKPFDTSGFRIESATNVPRQQNGSDCGVYSCMFAEYISRDVPITFCQTEMEYFRRKMVLEIAAGEIWN